MKREQTILLIVLLGAVVIGLAYNSFAPTSFSPKGNGLNQEPGVIVTCPIGAAIDTCLDNDSIWSCQMICNEDQSICEPIWVVFDCPDGYVCWETAGTPPSAECVNPYTVA